MTTFGTSPARRIKVMGETMETSPLPPRAHSHDIMETGHASLHNGGRDGDLKRPKEEVKSAHRGSKERRSRTIFNYAQLNALERIFVDVEYPDGDLKAKIAQRLEVDENTVQIWFQNRRAKKKRLHRLQPYDDDQPQHPVTPACPGGYLLPVTDRDCYFSMAMDGLGFPPPPLPPTNTTQLMPGHPGFGTHTVGFYTPSDANLHPSKATSLQAHHSESPPCFPTKDPHAAMDARVARGDHPDISPSSPLVAKGDEGTRNLIDKIRQWPVKEPATSQSGFGKLDFPRFPRVCIRHDTAQGRSPFSNASMLPQWKRDIATMRRKVLKKDPPRSPPPNQTCAAIPRSQRNELELALMKHGLVEDSSTSADSPNPRSGQVGGLDEWSSSSEESSDSEGLAPPKRRRKVVHERQIPPPNQSCTSVPVTDRTLPFLSNQQTHGVGNTSLSTVHHSPRSNHDITSVANPGDDDSDWDTDSDDSTWAYYDRGPSQPPPTAKVTTETKQQPSLAVPFELYGPKSAPPAIAPPDHLDSDGGVTALPNPDGVFDDLSDITLAREFAEMLPSPLGYYLPGYNEEPAPTGQGNTHNKRSRIQSDSALIAPRDDMHPHLASEGMTQSQRTCVNSPPSAKSTDSDLSGISSIFSIPVSPTEIAKHLSENPVPLDPTLQCEFSLEPSEPQQLHKPDDMMMRRGTPSNGSVITSQANGRVNHCPAQHPEWNLQYGPVDNHYAASGISSLQVGGMSIGAIPKTRADMSNGVNGLIRPVPTRPPQITPAIPYLGITQTPMSQCRTGIPGPPERPPISNDSWPQRNEQYHAPADTRPMGPRGQEVMSNGVPNQQCFPLVAPGTNIRPAGVVHHQPKAAISTSPHPGRFSHSFNSGSRPQAITMSANTSCGHGTNSSLAPSVVSVSAPPNAPMPPNQVCTAVPDAMSSQGLMARYLAWTQGRTLDA